jgi:hypothetical protein
VPKFNYAVSAAYDIKLAPGNFLYSRLDYTYSAARMAATSRSIIYIRLLRPTPTTEIPATAYSMPRSGLAEKIFDISVYAKNLGNDRKIIQEPEVNTVFEAYTVRPRTVGVTFKLRFN